MSPLLLFPNLFIMHIDKQTHFLLIFNDCSTYMIMLLLHRVTIEKPTFIALRCYLACLTIPQHLIDSS